MITFAAEGVRELRVAAAASDNGVSQASELAASALGVRGAVDGDGIDSDTDAVLAEHYRIISAYADDLQVRTDGRLAELNRVVPWFVQNALVHFLSPHGLEQYSGAAWGTRDVCQGPFELALAFGHFDTAREIILGVLRHQNPDGSLPQWFMFDEYRAMYQHDSHGDIPVWPLMAVGEYLEATGDTSVLGDTAPYWDEPNGDYSAESHTVCDHLLSILSYIRAHRVPGTELFSYGEGDWDDTLQPAQASMKKEMASTWTIALLYQATRRLGELLRGKDGCEALADQCSSEASTIRGAFTKDFIFDDVLAGYVSFTDEGPKPVIHPDDTRTGITYRLIPMTRSIIAGLLDDEETRRHEAIIDEHLHYPDGVRLMNRPAAYHDGVTTVFKRGEQAANVGREIGLMYTHAHIRYTEALAALGRDSVEQAVKGLNAEPVASGKYRVIFWNEALVSLLGVFNNIFSAETEQMGLSLLSGKLGRSGRRTRRLARLLVRPRHLPAPGHAACVRPERPRRRRGHRPAARPAGRWHRDRRDAVRQTAHDPLSRGRGKSAGGGRSRWQGDRRGAAGAAIPQWRSARQPGIARRLARHRDHAWHGAASTLNGEGAVRPPMRGRTRIGQ